MQTRSTLLDDLSQLLTNAAGIAQGAREEAHAAIRSSLDQWLRDSNLVAREDFDVVREMAQKAREENEALAARVAALEAALNKDQSGAG
ncbi:MAG: accessory factor UbiK family protein [Pseudomonadota bacterium]